MSRFGRGAPVPQDHRPTCKPCQRDEHERCPTAINNHGSSEFTSDFPCRCYHSDPDEHEAAVQQADDEFEAEREFRRDMSGWEGGYGLGG